MLKSKLLREPLLHFLLIGAALFFIYYATVNERISNSTGDVIVITSPDIERLAYLFEKTWNRPPNDDELRGVVDDYIEEEVLYREALKLGLDKNDTIVRRRMRQKMEFFINDLSEQTEPTEKQLLEFLDKNKDKFSTESRLSFKQIYFKQDKDTEKTNKRISDIKNKLQQQPTSIEDSLNIGDATILPNELRQATLSEIDNQFGKGFGARLSKLDKTKWEGPVESTYGFHLIFIDEFVEGHIPQLSEIRKEVERDWQYSLKKDLEQEYFKKKIDQYQVQILWSEKSSEVKTGETTN